MGRTALLQSADISKDIFCHSIILSIVHFLSDLQDNLVHTSRMHAVFFFFFNLRHVKLVFFLFLALNFLQFYLLLLVLAATSDVPQLTQSCHFRKLKKGLPWWCRG